MRRLIGVVLLVYLGGPAAAADFPLKVGADKRHLEAADGRPFLVVGDTAWSLIAQLTEPDTAKYLDDRRKRGFNAVIVSLIEHKFADKAPATVAGVQPFEKPGDFAHPNPAYFDWAHKAVKAANDRGISVWLCPAYLGWGGGDEGFFQKVKAAGPEALREYGKFVGGRFKDLPNIVWVIGGDYALPAAERWAGEELARGLRDGGAEQLMTAHGGQTTAVDTFGDRPWLAVDTVYRYDLDLWKPLRAAYANKPVRPFVMFESAYEGEHKAAPDRIRRQAWWPVLAGGCGGFFGNNPIWYFDGPGYTDRKAAPTWQQALDLPGSRDAARVGAFFRRLPWHRLVPDAEDKLVAKSGDGATKITAAATPDKKLAVVYVPSTGKEPRELTLNLAGFPGPVAARWFNPAKDANDTPAGTLPNKDGQAVRTPGDNGTGANDWALVLEVRPEPEGPKPGGSERPGAAGSTAPPADLAALRQKVQAKLDALREQASFPGASAGVVLADGRSFGVATGLADVEAKTPLKPSDRLLAGSVGKTFVAAVLLQLVEEGKLGLDDPLAKWLGKEDWFGRLPNGPDLTLRRLMNHTSGLPEYFEAKGFPAAVAADPDKVWAPAELVAFVLDAKPLFPAGKGWAYADTNYILAGMVAERAAGKPLFDEVRRRLLAPLKLERTVPSDRPVIPDLVPGYAGGRGNPLGYEGRTVRDGKFVVNPQFEWAGGGFASTPEDLARWAKALYEGKVFQKPETLAAMLDGVDTPTGRGGGKGSRYGLGVQLRESPWGPSYGHGGWFPGYRTEVEYFPDHKVAVAVQFNTDIGTSLKKGPRGYLADVARVVLPGKE